MSATRSTYSFSEECLHQLEAIRAEHGLKSITAAIEFIAAGWATQQALLKTLELLKKYTNELRRNDYLCIDLLNAITIQQDISVVPPHHERTMRSPALQDSYKNLNDYLNSIATKNKDGASALEEMNE